MTLANNLAYAKSYASDVVDAEGSMHTRKVSLFRNGRSQALRIPKEFEFSGKEVLVRKVGKQLIVEADEPGDLIAWLKTLEPLDEPFPEIDDLPAEDVRL